MDFRLLGSVDLCAGGRLVDLGPMKQRLVFAVLALDAGRHVPTESIVDRVWGEKRPRDVRNSLYSHLARIRRALAGVGVRLDRDRLGYRLDIPPDDVDVHRMASHARQERAELALEQWRGAPLPGLPGVWADSARHRMWRQYLDILTGWAAQARRAGNAADVVRRLGDAVDEHPHDEPLIAEFLRALHALGRTAEALDRYAAVHAGLREDLGVHPGPHLRRVHADLLRATPGTSRSVVPQRLQPPRPTGSGEVELRLLGPVRLVFRGVEIDLGPAKQRLTLAALLDGAEVPTATLIDRVWPDRPPAAARNALHGYLTGLRKALRGTGITIVRGPLGYRVEHPEGCVDAHRMTDLVDAARHATGAARATLFEQAMSLWHGDPLAGLSGTWADRVRARLHRHRLTALIGWAEALLEAGQPQRVATRLLAAVDDYPFAEPLAAQLVLALHRSGNTALARKHLDRTVRRLSEELGVEPDNALRVASKHIRPCA